VLCRVVLCCVVLCCVVLCCVVLCCVVLCCVVVWCVVLCCVVLCCVVLCCVVLCCVVMLTSSYNVSCFVSHDCEIVYWLIPIPLILFVGTLLYILTFIQTITLHKRQSRRAFNMYFQFYVRYLSFFKYIKTNII